MMNNFLLYFYRLIFLPFGICISLLASVFHKKLRAGFKMRREQKLADHPKEQNPIWFHCSSGEFEYSKSVIRELKHKYPSQPVLVTYFSPSYRRNVETNSDVDMSCAAPLDFVAPMQQFINYHKPKALLISRTDLWPEMLTQAKRYKIPTLLFSCSRRPPKWYQYLSKFYYNWLFSLIQSVYCVSEEDQLNLKEWAPLAQSKVRGDTRYDQVSIRLMNPKPIKDSLFSAFSGLTLVCGSTWPEDEDELFNLFPLVKNRLLRIVIVPHEPTVSHLQQIQNISQANGFEAILYSKASEWKPNEILLVDRIGILAELYMKADIAFVGGSFKSSVHSVMEPLAARALTFVGPKHKNNREAMEFQNIVIDDTLTAVTAVSNGVAMRKQIEHLLNHRNILQTSQSSIRNELLKKEGASQWVIEWIDKHTNGSSD